MPSWKSGKELENKFPEIFVGSQEFPPSILTSTLVTDMGEEKFPVICIWVSGVGSVGIVVLIVGGVVTTVNEKVAYFSCDV